MSTKAEFEAELAEIKAQSDYYERPDLISRRTFLETELNRLNGGNFPVPANFIALFPSYILHVFFKICIWWILFDGLILFIHFIIHQDSWTSCFIKLVGSIVFLGVSFLICTTS